VLKIKKDRLFFYNPAAIQKHQTRNRKIKYAPIIRGHNPHKKKIMGAANF
jgi:hypothetical protein